MPCYEYHPRRFVVEMDERLYDELMSLCRELLLYAFKVKLRRLKLTPFEVGKCLEVLTAITEKCLKG